jgi:hypothetical protein
LIKGMVVFGALVLAIAVVLIAYAIGSSEPTVSHLVGRASVGSNVASIRSQGTFYGVSESVAWIDETGSLHDDGWPDCFGEAGTTTERLRFGAVTVEIPDGGAITSVVYVDCRPISGDAA